MTFGPGSAGHISEHNLLRTQVDGLLEGGGLDGAAVLGVRVKSGGTWPARPDFSVVMSVGADPSPVDQLAGDLRIIPT